MSEVVLPDSLQLVGGDEEASQRFSAPNNKYMALSTVIMAFFASLPNLFLINYNETHSSDGGGARPIFYVLTMIAYGSSLFGIGMRLNWNFLPVLRAWPIWLSVIYAIGSVTWSIDPDQTLSRSIGLLGTTLAATFLATFDSRSQLRQMTIAFGVIMAISLLVAAIFPTIGIADHKGETVVRGIYLQKNITGWLSAIFAVMTYGAYRARATNRPLALMAFGLSIISVLLSRSATGIIALAIGLIVFWALGIIRKSGRAQPFIIALSFAGMAALIIFSIIAVPAILQYFGKTATFSGRTTLWEALLPAIREHLFLGWGFGGALWGTATGRDFFKYAFFAGNAQGGFVEILVNSGLIGVILFFGPYIYACFAMFRRSNRGDMLAEAFLVCLIVMAVIGFSAPIFLAVNQIYWIMTCLPILYQVGASSAALRTKKRYSSRRSTSRMHDEPSGLT